MILLLGGTSDIGTELTRRLCAGQHVVACALRPDDIGNFPGAASVSTLAFEATDLHTHRHVIEEAEHLAGEKTTTAIVAFGILGDQHRAETDETHAAHIATVDYTAHISMLTALADHMDHGHIVAFSSIAGWRARRANYVYGSTKAGLDAFCQGLADRLHGTNLNLYLARPGFVIGSMTEGMTPAIMSVRPHDVADAVATRIHTHKPGTFWIPKKLALLAAAMNIIPRPIWRHMPR